MFSGTLERFFFAASLSMPYVINVAIESGAKRSKFQWGVVKKKRAINEISINVNDFSIGGIFIFYKKRMRELATLSSLMKCYTLNGEN